MSNHGISECQTFLEVDDMKFMASDITTSENYCADCYFEYHINGASRCNFASKVVPRSCGIVSRVDHRNIIWMRIE